MMVKINDDGTKSGILENPGQLMKAIPSLLAKASSGNTQAIINELVKELGTIKLSDAPRDIAQVFVDALIEAQHVDKDRGKMILVSQLAFALSLIDTEHMHSTIMATWYYADGETMERVFAFVAEVLDALDSSEIEKLNARLKKVSING